MAFTKVMEFTLLTVRDPIRCQTGLTRVREVPNADGETEPAKSPDVGQ